MQSVETISVADVSPSENSGLYPLFKRGFDVVMALIGLVFAAPLGLLIAVGIWASDRGAVLFRQRRIGLGGVPFEILKFRTMVPNADRMGPSVTKGADPRITRLGRILRKTKLDELPQLWNVLVGDMSFVGPRPEVPKYVARYTPEQRRLLEYRPGITDLATLLFRNEEALLAGASDVENFYVENCIPKKFELNMRYASEANLWRDLLIIAATVCPYWLAVTAGYVVVLFMSLVVAFLLHAELAIPATGFPGFGEAVLVLLPAQILALFVRREMTGLLSYFGAREVRQLAMSLLAGAGWAFGVWGFTLGRFGPSPSIILINALISFCALSGARTWLREMRQRKLWTREWQARQVSRPVLRVGIIGAGELGSWVASELNNSSVHGRKVEVVFDDDPQKWHKHLHGIPIAGMPECILDGTWCNRLDEVIVAIPGATRKRSEEVREVLVRAGLPAKSIPALSELLEPALEENLVTA